MNSAQSKSTVIVKGGLIGRTKSGFDWEGILALVVTNCHCSTSPCYQSGGPWPRLFINFWFNRITSFQTTLQCPSILCAQKPTWGTSKRGCLLPGSYWMDRYSSPPYHIVTLNLILTDLISSSWHSWVAFGWRDSRSSTEMLAEMIQGLTTPLQCWNQVEMSWCFDWWIFLHPMLTVRGDLPPWVQSQLIEKRRATFLSLNGHGRFRSREGGGGKRGTGVKKWGRRSDAIKKEGEGRKCGSASGGGRRRHFHTGVSEVAWFPNDRNCEPQFVNTGMLKLLLFQESS